MRLFCATHARMKTEKEKMVSGELYNAADAGLMAERRACRELCRKLNHSALDDETGRRAIIHALLGRPSDVWIEPPFYCDYGTNIRLGLKVFFNFDCVVLDVAEVCIGDHVLIGPAVQIYTAMHPLNAQKRRTGLECAKPVVIGSDVWIGGGAIICPGVTIGDRVVIGAGSVVTRDVPDDVVIAGNPARIIRELGEG